MNNNLTSEVRNALEILKQAKVPYYQQIDCLSKISALNIQKKESKKSSKTVVILEVLGCYIVLGMIFLAILGNTEIAMICMPISFILAFFVRIPLHKHIVEREIQKNNYDGRIEKQKQLLGQYRNETSQILNSHLNELSVIPEIYFQKYKIDELVEVVNMLYEILASERADSKKEALNILENELHNRRMELAQNEIISQQISIRETVEYAAWQTQKAADYIALQCFFSSN